MPMAKLKLEYLEKNGQIYRNKKITDRKMWTIDNSSNQIDAFEYPTNYFVEMYLKVTLSSVGNKNMAKEIIFSLNSHKTLAHKRLAQRDVCYTGFRRSYA